MKYYKKLLFSIVLLFICYMILYYLNKTSFSKNNSSSKEGMNNRNGFNGCNSDYNNSLYGTYNFEKYYGRNSYKNGYSDKYYEYPVYTDKNYKNFSSNGINYNDVYDAVYDNIQTKGTKQNINNILNLMN